MRECIVEGEDRQRCQQATRERYREPQRARQTPHRQHRRHLQSPQLCQLRQLRQHVHLCTSNARKYLYVLLVLAKPSKLITCLHRYILTHTRRLQGRDGWTHSTGMTCGMAPLTFTTLFEKVQCDTVRSYSRPLHM